MEFYESDNDRLGLREIPPVLAELLRRIPLREGADSTAAEERLFPSPSPDPGEEGLRDDWMAHVQPELHEWFQSARQVVATDLRGMREEGDAFALEFPLRHADAWLNALNQARLTLAAHHAFGDDELAHPGPTEIRDERDLALLQINFYAALQQWLVEVMDA